MPPPATETPPKRPDFRLWAGLVVLTSLALKSAALTGELMMDDRLLISDPAQRGCSATLAECFQNPVFHLYYRPVLSASFLIGTRLHGEAPFWFHLENLLLHALAATAWLYLFRKTLRSDSAALIAGLLFALHPAQAGATAFIGGRTDTLALAALGVSLLCLISAANGRKSAYPVSVLCFAAALFAKEQAALTVFVLPPLLAIASPLQKRTRLFYAAPFALVVALYPFIAKTVLPPDFLPRLGLPPSLHVEVVGRTLWYYAKALSGMVPSAFRQSSLGAWEPSQRPLAATGYIIAGGWALFYIASARKNERLRLYWLWSSLALLPCLNIIFAPSQFIAPYRVPLVLPGVAAMVGTLLADFIEMRPKQAIWGAKSAFCALIAVYFALNLHETALWRNEIAVLQTMNRVDPDFLPVKLWLGDAFQRRENPAQALEAYSEIWRKLRLDNLPPKEKTRVSGTKSVQDRVWNLCGWSYNAPRFAGWVLHQEGRTLAKSGDYANATATLEAAFPMNPTEGDIRRNLAYCYLQTGRFSEAKTLLFTPADAPADAKTRQLQGYYFAKLGRWREASEALDKALRHATPLDDAAQKEARKLLEYVHQRLSDAPAP